MDSPDNRRGLAAALGAMLSVQIGAGIASDLFARVDPAVVLLVRQGVAATVLIVWARPSLRGLSRGQWIGVVGFGLTMSAMSLAFFHALDRIPLGLAVSIELCGPIAVAVGLARRRVDLAWAIVAGAGLAVLRAGSLDAGQLVGTLLAMAAAAGWAGYLLMSQQIGRVFERQEGLALGMAVAALCTSPFALAKNISALANPGNALQAIAVAVLSALVPFTLDLRAIRILGARMVSLLLALSPVIAGLVGLVGLRQRLSMQEVAGMMLIVVAATGALQAGGVRPIDRNSLPKPTERSETRRRTDPDPSTGCDGEDQAASDRTLPALDRRNA